MPGAPKPSGKGKKIQEELMGRKPNEPMKRRKKKSILEISGESQTIQDFAQTPEIDFKQ